jgi:hypothetical protein
MGRTSPAAQARESVPRAPSPAEAPAGADADVAAVAAADRAAVAAAAQAVAGSLAAAVRLAGPLCSSLVAPIWFVKVAYFSTELRT